VFALVVAAAALWAATYVRTPEYVRWRDGRKEGARARALEERVHAYGMPVRTQLRISPMLYEEMAGLLEEEGLDIDRYEMEVVEYSSRPGARIVAAFALGRRIVPTETERRHESFSRDVPRSLYQRCQEAGQPVTGGPTTEDQAKALAEAALEQQGISVLGRRATVRRSANVWICEYLKQDDSALSAEEIKADPDPICICVTVSKRTGKVTVTEGRIWD